MRMLAVIVWYALYLLATSSSLLAQEALEDVIERVEKSVIRIEVQGAKGPSLGSGFVVDNRGTIVTNCHVLAGAQRAVAFFPMAGKLISSVRC